MTSADDLAEALQRDGGFPIEFCVRAVDSSDGTMDGALAWVMEHMVSRPKKLILQHVLWITSHLTAAVNCSQDECDWGEEGEVGESEVRAHRSSVCAGSIPQSTHHCCHTDTQEETEGIVELNFARGEQAEPLNLKFYSSVPLPTLSPVPKKKKPVLIF